MIKPVQLVIPGKINPLFLRQRVTSSSCSSGYRFIRLLTRRPPPHSRDRIRTNSKHVMREVCHEVGQLIVFQKKQRRAVMGNEAMLRLAEDVVRDGQTD